MVKPQYRSGPYNIAYDTLNGETKLYCLMWMDMANAVYHLHNWQQRYGVNGGKAYPNGKGFFPFRNPRIVTK